MPNQRKNSFENIRDNLLKNIKSEQVAVYFKSNNSSSNESASLDPSSDQSNGSRSKANMKEAMNRVSSKLQVNEALLIIEEENS